MLTLYNLKRVGLLVEAEKTQAARQLGKVAAVVNIPLPCPFRSLCKRLNLVFTFACFKDSSGASDNCI